MHLPLCMRRALRLPDFDYSSAGAYFVTITTNDRGQLLGEIGPAASVALSDAGNMVDRWWRELPEKFESVSLDAHVVMPDHFHGIVSLSCGVDSERGCFVSLSRVVQWFKTMTTNEYFRRVRTDGWTPVRAKLWQRGFYDHVIRREEDLLKIREYIEFNPGVLFERYAGRTHGSAPTNSFVKTNPPAE
jgi:REP element-mobilizing transposase RayT